MERIVVFFVIGMLIIGTAGGFIISYLVYQPQIQSLRSDIGALEKQFASLSGQNEATLTDLEETISELNSLIEELNSTTPMEPEENQTQTFELIQIQQAQATGNGTHFDISFSLKNSGTADTSIILIYLNQYPIPYLTEGIVTSIVVNGTSYPTEEYFSFPIAVGDSAEGTITILEGVFDVLNFQSGATVELKFTSALRNDYSAMVLLP
jgi:hypothetical protein